MHNARADHCPVFKGNNYNIEFELILIILQIKYPDETNRESSVCESCSIASLLFYVIFICICFRHFKARWYTCSINLADDYFLAFCPQVMVNNLPNT